MLFRRQAPDHKDYRGYLDSASGGRISGWVWDRLRPQKRLGVEIHSAGTLVGIARADIFREDLLRSNIGDGRYGFCFEIPGGKFPDETIAAKVVEDDFWLLEGAGRTPAKAFGTDFINSARRGLPLLRPGLSQRTVDESDIEIAAELQSLWRGDAGEGAPQVFVNRDTMWGRIVSARHGVLSDLLHRSDPRPLAVHLVDLQKLADSDGLSQGDRAYRDFLAASPEGRRVAVAPFHDMLASLAQFIGVERADCAEQDYEGATIAIDQERLAASIESVLEHPVAPPTIFDGLFGLAIGDRILHGRDIQALYAALRAIEASGKTKPEICEIGGGFGKAAYYAWLRGVRRYTIVDLPTVGAMQYFYLRKTLPGVRIGFRHPSEKASEADGIDLLFASRLHEDTQLRSDIVLNCDSFPEMGAAICANYLALIPNWAGLLLSINHEADIACRKPDDHHTMLTAALPKHGFTRRYRFRSWVRRGYIEELWTAPNHS